MSQRITYGTPIASSYIVPFADGHCGPYEVDNGSAEAVLAPLAARLMLWLEAAGGEVDSGEEVLVLLSETRLIYLRLMAKITFGLTVALPNTTELFSKQELVEPSKATATQFGSTSHWAIQLGASEMPSIRERPPPPKFKPQLIRYEAFEPTQAPGGV